MDTQGKHVTIWLGLQDGDILEYLEQQKRANRSALFKDALRARMDGEENTPTAQEIAQEVVDLLARRGFIIQGEG